MMTQDRLDTLQQYLKENPDDPFLLFAIAQEYTTLQDYPHAQEYFLRLRKAHPEYIGMYYHWGKLALKLGDMEQAQTLFEEGLHIAQQLGDNHAWSELKAALDDLHEV